MAKIFECQSETVIFCSKNLETISLYHRADAWQIEQFVDM